MISHKYKCIFIHIQRTGGSSIEEMITGEDWWLNEPSTKHLIASQAKRLYAEYWNEYFKFSFVRHPVSRVNSCLKYAEHFGLSSDEEGSIDFTGYRRLYGSKRIVEFDPRFYEKKDVKSWKHRGGCVYGNILDEKLDFIGKYETLKADAAYLRERLHIQNQPLAHLESSERPARVLTDQSIDEIRALYKRDFKRFGYK